MADIRQHVTDLIAAPKIPAGVPEWNQGPRFTVEGQVRWSSPLSIDGEICPLTLIVDAYPRRRIETFTITLAMTVAITRVDYGPEAHFNGGSRKPQDIDLGLIVGPHCHLWRDNRHLATSRKLPQGLKYARQLPADVRGFANTFRWLCGDCNIQIGRDIPDLPKSDLLL
jgi:hypothetical protein